MQRLLGTGILTLASITALAACSGGGGGTGGGGGSSPTPPPVVTESYTFPADGTATTGTAWSIVGVKTTLSGQYGNVNGIYDTLRVDVTFVQNVANALPAPGHALSSYGSDLGVRISLDTDGNQNTGSNGSCNPNISLMPFEYTSDPGNDPSRLADGNYSILGAGGAPTYEGASDPSAEAVTSAAGNVFSQSFYLPTISVFDGEQVPRIGVEVGSFNGTNYTPTDCVPQNNLVEVFTTA